ncbi:MAG: histidine--tRNA ligase [Candidatus Omnitrophota bacterium]
MAQQFSRPRGTGDILPEESLLWQDIEQKARKIFSIYGYQEIRTPAFEETALFTRSLGETSDVVQKQMLNLEKEGLSLRPEGTASVVRSYIENSLDKKQNLNKLYYIGAMFRGERPQKGRLRQFHQIGVEAIGADAQNLPYLDAEVIILSANLLKSFGLKEDEFTVKINTLGSKEDKENFSGILREKLKNHLSTLCEDCQNRFQKNVLRVLDCKNKTCKDIVGKIDIGHSYLSKESQAYFESVKEALKEQNIAFSVEPNLVRGLDYYTHTVFEISSAALGSQDALGAGGRYNNLITVLGGPQVHATGFALGIERILLALAGKETAQKTTSQVFVVGLDERGFKTGFQIVHQLRASGYPSDMVYKITALKNVLSLLNKINAKAVIILGEDEVNKRVLSFKNLETREQESLNIGDWEKLFPLLEKAGVKKI